MARSRFKRSEAPTYRGIMYGWAAVNLSIFLTRINEGVHDAHVLRLSIVVPFIGAAACLTAIVLLEKCIQVKLITRLIAVIVVVLGAVGSLALLISMWLFFDNSGGLFFFDAMAFSVFVCFGVVLVGYKSLAKLLTPEGEER
jgi:hypothetical protein